MVEVILIRHIRRGPTSWLCVRERRRRIIQDTRVDNLSSNELLMNNTSKMTQIKRMKMKFINANSAQKYTILIYRSRFHSRRTLVIPSNSDPYFGICLGLHSQLDMDVLHSKRRQSDCKCFRLREKITGKKNSMIRTSWIQLDQCFPHDRIQTRCLFGSKN